jgi:hypothetical protein
MARHTSRVSLGPSGGPHPQPPRPARGLDGAAAPRGTPGRDDATPNCCRDTCTGAGALPQGHPQLLARTLCCYTVPGLPRTKNDLEQFFGAYRYHDRRTTGRKVASPGLVLSGPVGVIAAAATRLHTYAAAELAPQNVRAWQELRQARETRRQQRTLRRRFRRDPASYLAQLEADLLQLSLPP